MVKAQRDILRALLLGLAVMPVGGLAMAQAQKGQTPDIDTGPTGIQLTPSIGVSQVVTDTGAGPQSGQLQFVSEVTPGISISGETPHAKIDLNYNPSFVHYENGGQQDRVDQNFNTSGTIAPRENVTIPFQGYANEINGSGNSSNQQGILVPSNSRLLYYIGNIAPRYQTQFSDIATLDVTYALNSTNTSAEGAHEPGLGVNSTDTLGQNALVSVASGDVLGRLGIRADLSHTMNSGSGMNTDSTTSVGTLTLSYHINRVYQVSGSLGYQSIDYPANGMTAAYKSDGTTWTIGLTITPNELSTIALGYGKQQGAYSPTIQVGYALGLRTSISASYLVSVENQLTASLHNLQYLTYDQFGNPIDSRTGLPFSAVNQSFGQQNILFRDKPALLSISHQFTRSSLTLTGQYEVRNSLTGLQQGERIFGGTINYSQQFTPLAQGNISLGYTENISNTFGSPDERSHSVSFSGQFLYNLSDTTRFTMVENLFRTISDDSVNNTLQQQLTIGLTKSF